jgi:predicted metalloprotease with PDZ domain
MRNITQISLFNFNPNKGKSMRNSNNNIHYTVKMEDPNTHIFNVQIDIDGIKDDFVEVYMPVWTLGSYLVREFSKNIISASAHSKKESLNYIKINKNTWKIESKGKSKITFNYDVYAFEMTVRTSFLDIEHAMINGASVFMAVKGRESQQMMLTLEPYFEWTKVTTELTPDKGDAYRYIIKNYDELIDSPIELGNQIIHSFKANGVLHDYAIVGIGNFDIQKLKADSQKIIETAHAIFEDIPYDHYTFYLYLMDNAYGGLEHQKCSSLIYDRWKFDSRKDYVKFLGLVSHEFFHVYNVKRIRPSELGPFDYTQENYTKLLWIAEGMTAYYDNLILLRSGVITLKEYVGLLTDDIYRYESTPGRFVQSVEESSFDAWVKLYRQNENSSNTMISYYLKGSLIALALDLSIRNLTDSKSSFDDVFRILWSNYKETNQGFTEDEFISICQQVSGNDLNDIWNLVRSTDELDLNTYLSMVGLEIEKKYKKNPKKQLASIGVNFKKNKLFIYSVLSNSPAEKYGLNANDELIAINGIRLSSTNIVERLQTLEINKSAEFTISRNGLIKTLNIIPEVKPKDKYNLVQIKTATEQHKLNYKNWLLSEWNTK